jgi:fibronectin-binding autotransporter adhesin
MGTPTYGSAFGTGSSTNSVVMLSGVISSIPGMATPVYFGLGQDITSGINLTGINTFLGVASLNGGTLGINSNASLGNASNPLILAVGNSTAGGLVFLNGGVNLARPVEIVGGGYATRIVSNVSDVNTISGVISDYIPATYGGGRLYKAGYGTLILTGTNTYSGGSEIDAGTLSVGADANLGAASIFVLINSGATLAISQSFSTPRPLFLGSTSTTAPNGPSTIAVAAGQTFTPTGGISDDYGPGTLTLTGPGTVVLSTPNTYSGGTVVQQGTLRVSADAYLGAPLGTVTVNALGTLTFTGTGTTARAFTLNSGRLGVAAGQTLTLNGGSVGGGFLTGPGTLAVTGGAVLAGVTTLNSAVINQTGPASFVDVTNGGSLTISPGLTTTLTGLTNQGSGSITVGAVSVVNAADFQSYGTLTLNPAVVGSMTFTEMVNTGSSPLYFNGGSRTFIGTAATANLNGSPTFVAGIDLHGNNAVIAGGLFVNNGFVVDLSTGGTPGSMIIDYGALYKGAGYTGVNVITQNGGKVQAGNSPGTASFGRFVFGPGGVSNYVFAIDDATGTAGPSPDAAGHVSGWGLVKAIQQSVRSVKSSGDFTWTATPADKLTVAIDTLVNPTMVGTDVAGAMADFNPNSAYSWPAARWAGTYSGPTNAASLDAATSFDTSGFVNPVSGTFGWNLDPAGQALSLVYTPSSVPEPGTLVLVGLAAAGFVCWRRRGQPASHQHPGPA